MASRKVHNYIAKLLTNIPMSEIDEVNRKIDEPYKWLGRYHRTINHSRDAGKMDSVMITKGNPDKEILRQIHIYVDERPELGRMLEAYLLLKKRKR